MSEPTDIKALDEYLKGDSDVSRRYRELGSDEVPPELDRRVLTAARDAVANEGTQRSRSWLRWSAPVAVAASVVLVVTVVLERGPDKLAEEVTRQQAAKAQESPPVYIQPVTEASPPALILPDVAEPAPAVEQQSDQAVTAAVAPVSEAPAAAPPVPEQRDELSARESVALNKAEADAAPGVEETAVTGTRARRGPGRTAGPRGTVSTLSGTAGASRPASDDEQDLRADRSDPAAWLEEIRDLRRAGKSADADREWESFRKVFPDFEVADDDLARKKP